ncbi:hypothetical protein HOU70_gp25 [Arthrobacter phage Liebe]|uniref:Uncharacterized protein n=2 Tax=Arthrobacter virus Liebe TaxID=2734245 RepID=A0A3G2KHQ1_9CAUD|nr:hypothetical protein HOU70_gp25 [Arthrobacter phage Liebe]AYN58506.1 hypothetical protein PBI_MAUREEN_25 [Arthrobacter phage Maureen]AZF93758.1 hypothetical protein PBI_LIEBE_25 [Arthrobacter phage Liebe]
MSTNSTVSLSSLRDTATTALGRYYTGAESDRTARLRETAQAFVAAREFFFTREGLPDWLGRTYAYRRWVREVMDLARVPADDLPTIQSAVRYHTGNVLREHLDPDTLDALGLKHSSPRERSVEKRERNSGTLSLFGGGAAITDPDDVVRAAALVETFLRRLDLAGSPKGDRRRAAEALRDLCKHVCAAAETV